MKHAIETNYNGFRFRSRTEAKWAVFFDAAKIPYTYEAQSFVLDGVCYLPDFWLPEFGMWFEVKGEAPSAEEKEKAILLAKETQNPVLLCVGPPDYHKITYVPTSEEDADSFGQDYELMDDRRNEGEFWLSSENHGMSIGPKCGPSHDRYPCVWSACLRGINAAKSARFEFGEKPEVI